jgi:hypothetical protein
VSPGVASAVLDRLAYTVVEREALLYHTETLA